ncbi:queuosine precursor transporter [Patescibacteria group bacterium]|nr:queuosine precursor transporter [Patescibacteria group bacterium]
MIQNKQIFSVIVGLFVAVLLVSNLASTKVVQLNGWLFDGGTILFPLAYIFGDVLTEVYGYARARLVIWLGFFSLALMSVTLLIVQYLPPASDWPNQTAFETILGFVPRLALASLIAYLAGEFVNSYILSKLKIKTQGKYLWLRTISSTVFGQAVDTTIFAVVAFAGLLPLAALLNLSITIYLMKVGLEIICTPLTYKVIAWLKKEEGLDVYDKGINYSLFKWRA